MQKTRNNSRTMVRSNFRIEISEPRKNSLRDCATISSNRKINAYSSLYYVQRNIKHLNMHEIKRQILQTQFPFKSFLKVKTEDSKNNYTLQKNNISTTDNKSSFSETNNHQTKKMKILIQNNKPQKKKDKPRSINLLGLQIRKLQPRSHNQFRNTQVSCFGQPLITYEDREQKSQTLINDPNIQEDQQFRVCPTKQFRLLKKKALSQSSNTKYEYYHNKIQKFSFNIGSQGYKIYQRRFKIFQQFIFTIQLAHNIYLDNQIKSSTDYNGLYMKNEDKYKIWIGSGNNWMLIKSLIKRRYWWTIVQDRNLDQLNFVWTQLKVNSIFEKQNASETQYEVYELRRESQDNQSCQNNKRRTHSLINKPEKQQQKQLDSLNVQLLHKILNSEDKQIVKKYVQKNMMKQKKLTKPMQYRHKNINKQVYEVKDNNKFLVHNHLQNNFFLGNKKAMFYNLKQYYQLIKDNVFNYLPLTFHIRNGTNDIQYKKFLTYYKKRAAYIAKQERQQQLQARKQQNDDSEDDQPKRIKKLRNIWIVKPGELSNRGNGITVIDEVYEIDNMLNKKQKHQNGTNKTFIVQLYIDRPLLYNNRKFDIRHYMLITNMFGVMRGYWYQEGYIRTASYQFDIFSFQKQIHLTNDAVQKHTPNYGKYQLGNKLSYSQFQRYLDSKYPKKGYNFQGQIIPKMKKFATDAVKSAYLKLSPYNRQHNFEIFGLDFMIDSDFKPWLIQINTNPCLQLSSPLLQRIIPVMVENSFRLSLDVMFPPPGHYPNTSKHLVPDLSLQNHKYQLIFDSLTQGTQIQQLYRDIKVQKLMDQIGAISDQQDQYENDGEEIGFDQL